MHSHSPLNSFGYWTLNKYYYYYYYYLINNDLVANFQSAYKTGHSCETALLRVYNDIVTTIGRGNGAMLVLLDLFAAFDTIDHDNL